MARSFLRDNGRGRYLRHMFTQDVLGETGWRTLQLDFFQRDEEVLTLPPVTVQQAIESGFTLVTARADIYEADGTTAWFLDAPLIGGSISVDANRDERRTATIQLENTDGTFRSRPGGFWYDKVVRLYRGIRYFDTNGSLLLFEKQQGEFFIDDIDTDHFPSLVSVVLRDATRKLLQAKFVQSTSFAANEPIEEIIRAIALNGGIPANKIDLPYTGKNTARVFMFDRGTERWKAIKDIATAYNYDVYFRGENGKLTMSPFRDPADPAVSPSEYKFETGGRNLRNGSFDRLKDSTSPDWWTKDFHIIGAVPQTQTIETDLMHVRSGDHALKLINSTTTNGGSVASESIEVNPGEVWEIVAHSKAAPVVATGRYLRVWYGTTKDFEFGEQHSFVDPIENAAWSLDYSEDVVSVTIPQGVSWMRIGLYAWTTGTAYTGWWDDVSIERLEPAEDAKGNLVTYHKKTSSSRIYNHVVVTGESSDTIPVWAEAENNNPDSPTRISQLGRRTYPYSSSFIDTESQALELAERFLKIMGLEQFDVSFSALVAFFLDVNIVVDFIDPDGSEVDPTRFLLSDMTIPLGLEPMTGTAKRITLVG